MSNRARIIKLRQDSFDEFLDMLREANTERRIEGIACIAQIKYKDNEKPRDFSARVSKYWFGFDSCTLVLGLLELMKTNVLDYMAEMNQNEDL